MTDGYGYGYPNTDALLAEAARDAVLEFLFLEKVHVTMVPADELEQGDYVMAVNPLTLPRRSR